MPRTESMVTAETTARLRRAATEFVTIVVGVLTALALNGWAERREERALEQTYLRSLAADLETQVTRFDAWLSAFDVRAAVAEQVWQAVTPGAVPTLAPVDMYDALVSGGTYHPPRLYSDATYQDLVSTGNLRLIRDQRLKSGILNYHALRAQYLAWIDEIATESTREWKHASDGLLPAALTRARHTGELSAGYNFAPVLAAFRRREAAGVAVARTLSRYDDERYFAMAARDSAQSLIARIEAALALAR
jgi:hypothetical protein